VYLVFKDNILIAILLKRGNKNVEIKFSAHERFWNNLHEVAQNRKIGKPNNLIVLGAQCALNLISTFLLPLFSNIAIRMLSLKTRYTHCLI
jgi:hypothetical protein